MKCIQTKSFLLGMATALLLVMAVTVYMSSTAPLLPKQGQSGLTTPPQNEWRNARELRMQKLVAEIERLRVLHLEALKMYQPTSPEVQVLERKLSQLNQELARLRELGPFELISPTQPFEPRFSRFKPQPEPAEISALRPATALQSG